MIIAIDGPAGTGKSTICKALYASFAALENIDKRIKEQKLKSLEEEIIGFQIMYSE